MIDPKILDDLAKRFAENVPTGVRQVQTELEKNFRAVLQTTFAKMDLVTREEFDVQQGVLSRTRARLEALEKQVGELESKLSEQNTGSRRRATSPKKTTDKQPKSE